ncbi:MAG: tetratricopeptide repeat protein [Deltaproteobacteria bacterium]|nr:tetratricopeptide repeat protein [Deltaproteobacteria bacterium]
MRNRNSETHNAVGLELVTRGWHQEALSQFNKAIAKDPSYAPAYDNIAYLHAERGDFLEALKLYLKALESDPDDATIQYNFGCFLSNYANDMSQEAFELATKAEVAFPEAHFNLGLTLMSQSHPEEAIGQLQKAQTLDPDNADIAPELASAFLAANHFRQAIRVLRKAVQKNKEHQLAWFKLGSCYLQQGIFGEANEALSKALELDPQDTICMLELAALRFFQKKYYKSEALLEKALKLDRENVLKHLRKMPYLSRFAHILDL